jgi:hypothetical protein
MKESMIASGASKLIMLLLLTWAASVKADLIISPATWTGLPSNWSWSFGGFTYTISSTSEPAAIVDIPAGVNTWVFSSKGSAGDFYPVIVYMQTSTSAVNYATFGAFHKFMGSGVNPIIWWADLRAFSGFYAVTIVYAHRTSGGTSPTREIHAIGSTVAYNITKSADNDPTNHTTFYVGSADSGIGGFIQKCNNGTWSQMGFGVDCNTCLGPYVNSISVSSTGAVVTVDGNFEMGYNGSAPYEVDCATWGHIFWHSTGATTGYWATSP